MTKLMINFISDFSIGNVSSCSISLNGYIKCINDATILPFISIEREKIITSISASYNHTS